MALDGHESTQTACKDLITQQQITLEAQLHVVMKELNTTTPNVNFMRFKKIIHTEGQSLKLGKRKSYYETDYQYKNLKQM